MKTSPDSLLFKLWLLGFRILSFGAIAMGALPPTYQGARHQACRVRSGAA